MDTISDRLRALRNHLKLSGDEFGRMCDATKSAVSQWESGATRPSTANLINLHQETGVSIDWILTGHGPNPMGDQRIQRLSELFDQLDERGKQAVFRVAELESDYVIHPQPLRNGTR